MPHDIFPFSAIATSAVKTAEPIGQKGDLRVRQAFKAAKKGFTSPIRHLASKAAMAAVMIAGALLGTEKAADAAIVTTTITGTVTSGTDATGVFGFTPRGDLTGQSFRLVYSFDDTKGVQSVQDCVIGGAVAPCSSSITNTATSSPGTAVLQIGSGTWTFGTLPGSTIVLSKAARSANPAQNSMQYYVQDSGGSNGTDGVNGYILPAAGTSFTTDYKWQDAFTSSSLGPATTTFAIGTTLSGGTQSAFGSLQPQTITIASQSTDANGKALGDCGCNGNPGYTGSAGVAEPINVATGNVFEQVTDYKTAGPNPLSFTRYYNSLQTAANPNAQATGLGNNWRSNFDRYLNMTSASSVQAERADGQVLTFALKGGVWTPDTDVDAKLTNVGSSWTLTDHNDTVETYTVTGNKGVLNSIKERNGYTQTLNYSGGLLASVTDSYNRSLNFTHAGGLLQTVSTPDNLTLTYGFTNAIVPPTVIVSGASVLISVSYSTTPSTSLTYQYNNPAFPFALTGIIDESDQSFASWTYDAQGRGISNQRGTGAELTTLAYNSDGSTTVTNALGVADIYKFANLQGVQKVTEVDRAATASTGAATRLFTYDANGFLASSTEWNGTKTSYANNALGNPNLITEAVGTAVTRKTSIAYDPSHIHLPQQIITDGMASTFAYDAAGNPLSRTDLDLTTNTAPYATTGQTRVTSWTWSATGQELSEQRPRTDVVAKTSFTYDSTGALATITDALNHQTHITAHTGGGLPLTVIDPNNVTTTMTYDGRLHLQSSTLHTSAGNLTTSWTYDPAGNLQSLQLPDNSKLTYAYDTAHRLTGITDLFGNTITYTLDALGGKTATVVSDPSVTVTQKHSAVFNALGRMTSDIGGMGQTTVLTYDSNGNVLTIKDPLNNTVTNSFDALNRLSTRTDPVPGGTTTLTYDAHDRVLTVKDANGNTTSNTYNGFGDRTQTISPDSGTTVITYDNDRNPTQIVKPGPLTATMTYDALDRPLATSYPADRALSVTRIWDETTGHGFGIGHLTSARDAAGSLALTYDERGNVTHEQRSVPNGNRVIVRRGIVHTPPASVLVTSTAYDASNNIASITYPSGTVANYGRDAMGRVTSVTAQPAGQGAVVNVATGIAYEPFGPVTGLTYGNGIVGSYGYDADYRPTARTDTGATAVQNLSYGYDAADNVKTITDAVKTGNSQTMGYDALNRLTGASSGAGGYGSYGFTWDPVGNIKTQTINGATTTYGLAAGSNRLAQWTGAGPTETVSTTPAGNIGSITASGSAQDDFVYNQANQLARAATPLSYASYTYDLDGQRLEKAVPGSYPILYQYGQAAKELLSENDLRGGQAADYIYLNGKPIGEVTPNDAKLYFTHTDRLGTPQKLTDNAQSVVWNAEYRPFGDTGVAGFSGPLATQSLRLPGQQFDPETGLNHNGFRDYAAGLTRYVQSDPIGLAGGMNTYQYVQANPFKNTDRSGLIYHDPMLSIADRVAGVGQSAPYAPLNTNDLIPFLDSLSRNSGFAAGLSALSPLTAPAVIPLATVALCAGITRQALRPTINDVIEDSFVDIVARNADLDPFAEPFKLTLHSLLPKPSPK